MTAQPLCIISSFEDILDELEILARDQLLVYRVQVGSVLLRHFWGDDPRAFSSPDRTKAARFDLFFSKCSEPLARYGLSQRQARDSIRAAIVVRTLPSAVVDQLFLTQLLVLARLRDPTQRLQVADAAVASDWSLAQLRAAVSAVRAGLPLDGDPDAPGVQVPAALQDARKPVAGRLVTRAEKLANDVETWTQQWTQVDASRLRHVQRVRLAEAADRLEAQVAALRQVIAADGPGGDGVHKERA